MIIPPSNAQLQLSPKMAHVQKAIEKNWPQLKDMHMCTITVSVPLLPDDPCVTGTLLDSFMRMLINSKQTIDKVDNRTWFKERFWGGSYSITVKQASPTVAPFVLYKIVCFSMDECVKQYMEEAMSRRISKLLPKAQVCVDTHQYPTNANGTKEYFISLCSDEGAAYFDSLPVKSLNRHLQRWLMQNMAKGFENFGELYRMVHRPYKYRNYFHTLT